MRLDNPLYNLTSNPFSNYIKTTYIVDEKNNLNLANSICENYQIYGEVEAIGMSDSICPICREILIDDQYVEICETCNDDKLHFHCFEAYFSYYYSENTNELKSTICKKNISEIRLYANLLSCAYKKRIDLETALNNILETQLKFKELESEPSELNLQNINDKVSEIKTKIKNSLLYLADILKECEGLLDEVHILYKENEYLLSYLLYENQGLLRFFYFVRCDVDVFAKINGEFNRGFIQLIHKLSINKLILDVIAVIKQPLFVNYLKLECLEVRLHINTLEDIVSILKHFLNAKIKELIIDTTDMQYIRNTEEEFFYEEYASGNTLTFKEIHLYKTKKIIIKGSDSELKEDIKKVIKNKKTKNNGL